MIFTMFDCFIFLVIKEILLYFFLDIEELLIFMVEILIYEFIFIMNYEV